MILSAVAVCAMTGCLRAPHGADPFDLQQIGLQHQQGGRQHEYALPDHPGTTVSATIPTNLAVARVQGGSRYRHGWMESSVAYSGGNVIAIHDTLTDSHRDSLNDLYGINDVITLAPPPTPRAHAENTDVIDAIRREALRVHADLLLLLTFETDAKSEAILPPLSLLTLGMLPHDIASADAAGYAVLMDARTGHIFAYGTVKKGAWQLANTWTADEAEEDTVRRAERKVITKLIDTLEPQWPAITHTLR